MIEELSPEEVKTKVDETDVQVIDIRPERQYESGHIPGAVNVPMAELPSRVDELDWSEDIVVACPIGQSSIQAARLIDSYEAVDDDSDVRSMAGGYREWDYELETGDATEDG